MVNKETNCDDGVMQFQVRSNGQTLLSIKDDQLRLHLLPIVISITCGSLNFVVKIQSTLYITNHSQFHLTVNMRFSIVHCITLVVIGLTRAENCDGIIVDVRLAMSRPPHP